MSDATQDGRVLPSPRIPKVLGILNIVFASGLILVSLCMGGYRLMLPAFSQAMGDIQKKAEAQTEARRQADLKAIEEEEKAAATDGEKEALAAKRRAIEARPRSNIPMMDMSKLWDIPALNNYTWIDVLTGLVVNVAMLVAGIGLVRRKLWGITLGIWTAIAKIVRLVLVYSYFALGVVPGLAQTMGKLVAQMMIQQQQAMGQPAPPGLDTNMMVRVYYITYSVTAVALIVFGSIYPAVSLWLLTRPGARAACDESAPSGMELNESW